MKLKVNETESEVLDCNAGVKMYCKSLLECRACFAMLLVLFSKFYYSFSSCIRFSNSGVSTPTTYPLNPKVECCCAQNNGNKPTCSSQIKPQFQAPNKGGRERRETRLGLSAPMASKGHQFSVELKQ